jgi:GTP-binding protein HflX
LPPTIIEAFRATLEELDEAAILLHVVDATSHNAAEQCQVVDGLLNELGLSGTPHVTALNKIDLLLDRKVEWDEEKAIKFLGDLAAGSPDTVLVSAIKRWGLINLMSELAEVLARHSPENTSS